MLLVALTDIHGKNENIDRIRVALAAADAVIISGDITHFGREKEAIKVLENIKRYNPDLLARVKKSLKITLPVFNFFLNHLID